MSHRPLAIPLCASAFVLGSVLLPLGLLCSPLNQEAFKGPSMDILEKIFKMADVFKAISLGEGAPINRDVINANPYFLAHAGTFSEYFCPVNRCADRIGADQLPASLCSLAGVALERFAGPGMATLSKSPDGLALLTGFDQWRELLLEIICRRNCSPLPLGLFPGRLKAYFLANCFLAFLRVLFGTINKSFQVKAA